MNDSEDPRFDTGTSLAPCPSVQPEKERIATSIPAKTSNQRCVVMKRIIRSERRIVEKLNESGREIVVSMA